MKYVRATMGPSKIEVFRHILGDEDDAQRQRGVPDALRGGGQRGRDRPMAGAAEVFNACRGAGIKVCLATGFSPATRDAIVEALGWADLVDLMLSPADADRGRPWLDLPLTALLRLGGGSVGELAVVGETPSDVESGLRGRWPGGRRADRRGHPSGTRGCPPGDQQPGEPLVLDSIADLLPHLGS